MPTLDRETAQLITSARKLGGVLSINLSDDELLRLCAVIAVDMGEADLASDIADRATLAAGYYNIPLDWFAQPVAAPRNFPDKFVELRGIIPDFPTYFKSLCALHKRRLKFHQILERQRIPRMEQIVPCCLLEYGFVPSEMLASWLVWRKWLYDIDNRSAQETGYLFEPILASALGGVPFSSSASPIRRANDRSKGRQVDCIEDSLAYEFKMRVTIAASGQGRFQEELDFARDCRESGYTPILLVLDPTTSSRLEELSAEYERYGGQAFVGNTAWKHIEDKAGPTMGRFVERYVRAALAEIERAYTNPQALRIEQTGTTIVIQVGREHIEITRTAPPEDFDDESALDVKDEHIT